MRLRRCADDTSRDKLIAAEGAYARPRGESRDALLDAAGALMAERDSTDIRMVDIAAGAGVNHAMVKYHFGNKEGLLFALIERDMNKALDRMDRLLALDLSPEERMRLHLRGIFDTYYRMPYLNRLVQRMMRDSEAVHQRRIGKGLLSRIAAAQEQMLREGMEAGAFREVNPKFFYFTTIGSADGLYSNRFTMSALFGGIPRADEALHEQNREQTVELLMRGILK